MPEKTATPGWGGRRPGAGRKTQMKDTQKITFHMPGTVVDALHAEAAEVGKVLSVYMRDLLRGARPDLPWRG